MIDINLKKTEGLHMRKSVKFVFQEYEIFEMSKSLNRMFSFNFLLNELAIPGEMHCHNFNVFSTKWVTVITLNGNF